MKANEAPEKLYVALNELTEDGHTFVLDHRVDYPICTEYTRTDAFIEKAKKWFEEHFGNRLKWEITTYEFEDMQSMVKDFRNYMKGEKI